MFAACSSHFPRGSITLKLVLENPHFPKKKNKKKQPTFCALLNSSVRLAKVPRVICVHIKVSDFLKQQS